MCAFDAFNAFEWVRYTAYPHLSICRWMSFVSMKISTKYTLCAFNDRWSVSLREFDRILNNGYSALSIQNCAVLGTNAIKIHAVYGTGNTLAHTQREEAFFSFPVLLKPHSMQFFSLRSLASLVDDASCSVSSSSCFFLLLLPCSFSLSPLLNDRVCTSLSRHFFLFPTLLRVQYEHYWQR